MCSAKTSRHGERACVCPIAARLSRASTQHPMAGAPLARAPLSSSFIARGSSAHTYPRPARIYSCKPSTLPVSSIMLDVYATSHATTPTTSTCSRTPFSPIRTSVHMRRCSRYHPWYAPFICHQAFDINDPFSRNRHLLRRWANQCGRERALRAPGPAHSCRGCCRCTERRRARAGWRPCVR
jgi:hypothetical protein